MAAPKKRKAHSSANRREPANTIGCRAHKFVMADQLVLLDIGTAEALDLRAGSATGREPLVSRSHAATGIGSRE